MKVLLPRGRGAKALVKTSSSFVAPIVRSLSGRRERRVLTRSADNAATRKEPKGASYT